MQPGVALLFFFLLYISGVSLSLQNQLSMPKFPAFHVIGDSIADSGNNNGIHTLTKSNFPPYGRDFLGHKPTGRFSNGKIITDFIASELGIKELLPAYVDPTVEIQDLVTGVSFALLDQAMLA